MKWLLNRIQSKSRNENRGYAAELLSILLQNNRANRLELGKQGGVEAILIVLSVRATNSQSRQKTLTLACGFRTQQYRRKDPVDADEAEFMENVFDSLCSALAEPEIKKLFLDSEGVDLMVLMMKYVTSCLLLHLC